MGDDNDNQEKIQIQPPKKNQSAYFHFMSDKRSEIKQKHQGASFGDLTIIATNIWKNLSDEEKQVYKDKAKQDQERYKKEIEAALSNGVDFRTQKKTADDLDSPNTIFPTARIKKVVKLDNEVKKVSADAYTAITKAADLFVAFLAEHAHNSSTARRKKTIDKVDVHQSIYSGPEPLDFLVPDFEKPIVVQREKKKPSKKKMKLMEHDAASEEHDQGNNMNSITAHMQ